MNRYQEHAMRTRNPGLSKKDHLAAGVMGLSGEAGEVTDHVKKHLYHGHELDRDKVLDELGDVLWYIAYLAHTLGFSLEDIARHNGAKLTARYPEGFSENRSKNRQEVWESGSNGERKR